MIRFPNLNFSEANITIKTNKRNWPKVDFAKQKVVQYNESQKYSKDSQVDTTFGPSITFVRNFFWKN